MNTQKLKQNLKGFVKKHEDTIVKGGIVGLIYCGLYVAGAHIYREGIRYGYYHGSIDTLKTLLSEKD